MSFLISICFCACVKESDKDIHVTNITLERQFLMMEVGGSEILQVTVTPSTASNKKILWTSDNHSVATVSDGVVSAHKIGKATITATSEDGGQSASCDITVLDKVIPVTGVSISPESIDMIIGDIRTLKVIIEPSDATDKSYTLSSSDDAIVSVRDNVITAQSQGQAIITVEASGFTATCVVKVRLSDNPLASIDCAPNEILYMTKYGLTIKLGNEEGFGGNFVSDTYEDGFGKLVFGNDVTTIPENAFAGCNSITYIKLPDGVKDLQVQAFSNCSSLKEIYIPDSVELISTYCFEGCHSLERISFPHLKAWGAQIFKDCTGTLYYNGRLPTFSKPEIYGLFIGSKFSEIAIIGNTKKIGDYSFYNCTDLQSVTLCETVSSIGPRAFSGCSTLASCPIPKSVQSIGDGAFNGCKVLDGIRIPDGLNSIGEAAFKNCSSLSSPITIPASVKTIGSSAFYGCESLTNVEIQNGVEEIGSYAFFNCKAIQALATPKSVKTIGRSFAGNCTFEWTVYPTEDMVSTRPESDFLGSIILPEDTESLPENIFGNTHYNFKGFKGKYANSNGLFLVCNETLIAAKYAIGNNDFPDVKIRRIGKGVFETRIFNGVLLIRDFPLTIPEGVEEIGRSAFINGRCYSNRTIILPSTLRLIEEDAFFNMMNYSVYLNSIPQIVGINVFTSLSGSFYYTKVIVNPGLYFKWNNEADDSNIPIYSFDFTTGVDLGLSVKWLATNIGAKTPTDNGLYYAWGETDTKNLYDWSNYKWGTKNSTAGWDFTKYNFNSSYGEVDYLYELEKNDDVAYVQSGRKWHIPNNREWEELMNNCTWTRTVFKGVDGMLIESRSSEYSIFLPAAGYFSDKNYLSRNNYMSSSLSEHPAFTSSLTFYSEGSKHGMELQERAMGYVVRPVLE